VEIRDVLRWEEITSRKPSMYMVRPVSLHDCWICYLEPKGMMLTSSEIIVVARETGEVVYAGSASDEG